MADTIGLLTGRISHDNLNIIEKRSYFALEYDVVKKWVQAHKKNELGMRERNTRIIIENYNFRSGHERIIYHRKRLIDMVIYNLIDNALKYCHWGTNIHITIGSEGAIESLAFPVTIENYGTFIEPEPQAYELYYKGKIQSILEGDGLGLYVAKTVSDMIELGIHYDCKKIADYNVGLMDEYIQRGKDKDFVKKFRCERESKSGYYKHIINTDRHETVSDIDLTSKRLEKDINQATYHVAFTLCVQVKSEI
jgi:hypothetical protein